jgi:sugar/nucleoside kinase (ribokinase family)
VELRDILKHTQVLLINDEETCQLAGDHNLMRAARRVLRMGPQTLVIKRGEFGAILVAEDSVFTLPGYPHAEVRDPTGAGDAFAGGFLGWLAGAGRVNDATLRQAMVYGSVLGSFTVEGMGMERIRKLKRGEIKERAREFARLTQFKL